MRNRTLLAVAAAVVAAAAVAALCAFVTWGASPKSWAPQDRFIVAVMALLAAAWAFFVVRVKRHG